MKSKKSLLIFDVLGVLVVPDFKKHQETGQKSYQEVPGMYDLLGQLKASGCSIFGLSNCSVQTFNLMREQCKVLSKLDQFLLADEVGYAKPDPKIFTTFLHIYNLNPKDCFFIDDSFDNIKAAQTCGIDGQRFASAAQCREVLQKQGIITSHEKR